MRTHIVSNECGTALGCNRGGNQRSARNLLVRTTLPVHMCNACLIRRLIGATLHAHTCMQLMPTKVAAYLSIGCISIDSERRWSFSVGGSGGLVSVSKAGVGWFPVNAANEPLKPMTNISQVNGSDNIV